MMILRFRLPSSIISFHKTATNNLVLKNFINNNNKNQKINLNLPPNFHRYSTLLIFRKDNNNGHKFKTIGRYLGDYCFMSTNPQSKKSTKIIIEDDHDGKIDRKSTKKFSNKIYTIPNILCMARIGITPLIGYLIVQNNFTSALTVCAISSLTDFLDGWIARNFNSESKLGAVLDPLADKLLVATLTLTLTYVNMIPIWLTLLIFTRDFLIISGGFYMQFRFVKPPRTLDRFFDISAFKSDRFRPTLISKFNTAFQLSLVLMTLASPLFVDFFNQYHLLLPSLQWATGLTTLWSGLLYLKRL